MPLVAGLTEAKPLLGAWLAALKQPQLTFASPRDEAAFVLFVSNNTRLSAARVRCVMVLVWGVSLLQLGDNFCRSPLARRVGTARARCSARRTSLRGPASAGLVLRCARLPAAVRGPHACASLLCPARNAVPPRQRRRRLNRVAAMRRSPLHLLRFAILCVAYVVSMYIHCARPGSCRAPARAQSGVRRGEAAPAPEAAPGTRARRFRPCAPRCCE